MSCSFCVRDSVLRRDPRSHGGTAARTFRQQRKEIMNQKDDPKRSEKPESPALKLRKRFRIEKIEERIAPAVLPVPYGHGHGFVYAKKNSDGAASSGLPSASGGAY